MNKVFSTAAASLVALSFQAGSVLAYGTNKIECSVHQETQDSKNDRWVDFTLSDNVLSIDANSANITTSYQNAFILQQAVQDAVGKDAVLDQSALEDAVVGLSRIDHTITAIDADGTTDTQSLHWWEYDSHYGHGRAYGSKHEELGIATIAERNNRTGSNADYKEYDSFIVRDLDGENFGDTIWNLDLYDRGDHAELFAMFRTVAEIDGKKEDIHCILPSQTLPYEELFIVLQPSVEL